MGGRQTNSAGRYDGARLTCTYQHMNPISRAVVSARDSAQFHHQPERSSLCIAAMLNFLYSNHIRDTRSDFYFQGTAPFWRCDPPPVHPIEQLDEVRRLL